MTAEYLFVGNVPPSRGSYHLPSGEVVLEVAAPPLREALRQADERGQARLFAQAARELVFEHPWRFAAGVARKLLYFWTWAPQTGVLYPRHYLPLYLAAYAALVAGAGVGVVRGWRASADSRQVVLSIAVVSVVVSGLHALLYFELRHRWALEPLLVVLASTCALPRGARAPHIGDRDRRSDGGDPR
jgi:hypothetical protein